MLLLFYVMMNHWGTAWKLWTTVYKWTQRQKATVTINWRELHNEHSSASSSKNVQDWCIDMSVITKGKEEQYIRRNSVMLCCLKKERSQDSIFFFFGVGGVVTQLGMSPHQMSHHLCWPLRHCPCATCPNNPTSGHTPQLILHHSPTPRGPQEMSDHCWATIQRKHCIALLPCHFSGVQ